MGRDFCYNLFKGIKHKSLIEKEWFVPNLEAIQNLHLPILDQSFSFKCTLSAPQNVEKFCFLSDASNNHWKYKFEPNDTYLSPKESFSVHIVPF